MQSTSDVLDAVYRERTRQNTKWGPQNHNQMVWLGILAEEFGEAAKEINELFFRPAIETHHSEALWLQQQARTREELVQVAAVAVAMIESLERNGK